MSNETEREAAPSTETPTSASTAVAERPDTSDSTMTETGDKLPQTVDIQDAGPCKKHIKVTIDRKVIDERANEKFKELVRDQRSQIDGFRPGKAPRSIVVRRYHKAVMEQVKNEILMASLEQLATENQIAPLSPPNLDPNQIEIPESGPFIYEFDVEVRPEFELPNYKGLKLKRPTKKFTESDIDAAQRRLLEPISQLVPKPGAAEGNAVVELNDTVTADVVIKRDGKILNEVKEVQFKVSKELYLTDGVAPRFGEQLCGAKVGETRTVDITIAIASQLEGLRGMPVIGEFTIKDIKQFSYPDLTPDLLATYGASSVEQFREMLLVALEKNLEYTQRQSARRQVMELINEASTWELPQDLLIRQSRITFNRRIREMREAGMTEEEIRARTRRLEQDVLKNTAMALKEHFVLQKIAEVEKIEVTQEDIDVEIERLAERSNESVRRVRARLEKEDLLDTIAADLLERRALDLILNNAEYEDVPLNPAEEAATTEASVSDTSVVPETASAVIEAKSTANS